MKVPNGCLYNFGMIGLLFLLHVGVFYFESKGDVPGDFWGSICWLLLFLLSVVNLILKPYNEDGFWNCHNSTIIIILIIINVLAIVFGLLKKIDEGWYIIVEVCALLVEDIIFLRHICVAPDANTNSQNEQMSQGNLWQPMATFQYSIQGEQYSLYKL